MALYKVLRKFFETTCYEFVSTSGQVWRYTNSKRPVTYGGNTYTPQYIKHGKVTNTQSVKKMPIEIRLRADHEIVDLFVASVPTDLLRINMFHYDPDIAPADQRASLYTGRLLSGKIEGREAKLMFAYDLLGLNTPLTTNIVSVTCPLELYSARCGVDPNAYTNSYTVGQILNEGRMIITSTPIAEPSGYYTFGALSFNGVHRGIAKHYLDEIHLHAALRGLNVGDTILLRAGCNKSVDDCVNKFNNVENFGGCPYMPLIDIYNDGARIV